MSFTEQVGDPPVVIPNCVVYKGTSEVDYCEVTAGICGSDGGISVVSNASDNGNTSGNRSEFLVY